MKKLLLFLIVLCISPIVKAQNFHIIPENSERIVFNGFNYYYAEVIESVVDQTDKTEFHLQGKLNENFSNNLQGIQCYENEFPSELGLKITIDKLNNDQWIQLDIAGDILARIVTNSTVGETWEFVTYKGEIITATCESIFQATINGLSDNFKTISFSAFPCKLVLSENHGVIETPDWSSFAKEENLSIIRCLEREFNPQVLEKFEVPFGDLASQLVPGDEIHILESNCHFSLPNCTERNIKATYISKTFDDVNNKYLLSFRHEVLLKERTNHVLTETTYADTAIHTVPRFIPAGVTEEDYPLSINKLFWVEEEGIICHYHYFFNNRMGLTFATLSYQGVGDPIDYENCFPEYTDTGSIDTYLDGLAGPYYDYYFSQTRRLLNYYKKGNEEWGTPYTFTVATREKVVSEQFNVFPNPVGAGSALFLQLSGSERDSRIQLLDIHGKLVQNWSIDSSQNQQVVVIDKNINPGLYILWIDSQDGKRFYSKVLIK